MTDALNAGNGAMAAAPQIQVRVLGQYIKDLSFENPNIEKMASGQPPEEPSLKLEINVEPKQINPTTFESAVHFKAEASAKHGTIYEIELIYGGMFRIENAPPQALEPLLHINAPSLLFPFVRRIIADLTREGGFAPLLLDPIDFASLLMQKKQQLASAVSTGGSATA